MYVERGNLSFPDPHIAGVPKLQKEQGVLKCDSVNPWSKSRSASPCLPRPSASRQSGTNVGRREGFDRPQLEEVVVKRVLSIRGEVSVVAHAVRELK
jgi:hypothetical protein